MAVDALVKVVIQKLGDFLIQEAVFLCKVRDQVDWVERELRRIRCFLKDSDAKQDVDEGVKNWVADVRDVAYDAEDIIDTFILKLERRRRDGLAGVFERFTIDEFFARHEVGNEIERIKNKIHEISEGISTCGIKNIGEVGEGSGTSRGKSLREERRTSPLFGETQVVGFEEDKKELVARLIKGQSRRCVVSIVGMGGLGKTILAINVYNDAVVKRYFDCCAWVFVSQEYAARDLLHSIIKCFRPLTTEELETTDHVLLRETLFNHLKEMRYLVVLDDIWNTEAWDSLAAAFPNRNNGSRVLLTTRNRDVASYADAWSSPHHLKLLGDEDSWELFCKKAFLGEGIQCPQNLEKIGKEIVGKCRGLPLAIVVMGGLISRRTPHPSEWEKILKRISSQFVEDESRIKRILSLSYEDLPHRLKPYFLYFGIFLEDREFHVKKLIRLWAKRG